MYDLIRLPIATISLSMLTAFMPLESMKENSCVTDNAILGKGKNYKNISVAFKKNYDKIFSTWQLEKEGISKEMFAFVMKGYDYLNMQHLISNPQFISIVDFSKPSTQKRLYILDVETGEILYHTYVAHGRNSGKLFANNFSNKNYSLESSLGFYVTSDTYFGKNGFSLRLEGCEKGLNDKALNRGIVLHGADYVSENFIQKNGFLGRSHGCPAVPANLSKEIIETIKNGSCLFIYAPSKKYLKQSTIINS